MDVARSRRIDRRRLVGGAAGLTGTAWLGWNRGAAAQEADPVAIEYWHINTDTFGGPAVKELVGMFGEAAPNIAVAERFHPNSYTGLLENLQTSLAAGTPPDVAQIGYLYIDYVVNNFPYVPVGDLVAEFGGEEDLAEFPANVLDLGTAGGVQVGMPYAISNCITYVNADMMRSAGLDAEALPTTWAEWRAAAERMRDEIGKPAIYVQLLDDNWTLQAMIESNGGQLLGCEGESAVAAFDSPEGAAALQFWADLVADGLALNVLAEQGGQAFLSGEVATYVTTIARRAGFQEQAPFELTATTFPAFGEQPVRLPAGGNILVVFSQDEAKRRAAWEFVRFLESPEALTVWTEGTGYIPPRDGVADDPRYLGDFMAENPIQAVGVGQTPNVVRWVSFPGPNGLQGSKALFAASQEALGGQRPAAEALAAAADEIDGLIQGQPCS